MKMKKINFNKKIIILKSTVCLKSIACTFFFETFWLK